MSKKRAPVQDREHREATRKVEDQQDSHDLELSHGNEALKRQLAPERGVDQELQLVRETALPTVEQALLAVQIAPQSAELTGKLIDTLESSSLPEARREALLARLQEDQAVATLISQALEGAFGLDTPELRESLWSCLDESWTALVSEGATGDWSAEVEASLGDSSKTGSLSERAVSTIGDLSAHFSDASIADQAPTQDVSQSVQQFCRSIALLLFLEEEEEEEEMEGMIAPELD